MGELCGVVGAFMDLLLREKFVCSRGVILE
jgi:hypothetical protein